MPSRPRSSFELLGFELRRPAMLMNSEVAETFAVLLNTRTDPVFCTTYQRAELPGSCNMAIGCVKFGKPVNARCRATDTVPLGASPARQLVFAGRASSPLSGGAPPVVALAAVEAAETLAGVAP